MIHFPRGFACLKSGILPDAQSARLAIDIHDTGLMIPLPDSASLGPSFNFVILLTFLL